MPAKVTVTTVTTTERQVEIPDRCPGCGTDLTETQSIRESGYVAFSSYCHVDGDEVRAEDEFDHDFADSMRTRYECLSCSHVLAEG